MKDEQDLDDNEFNKNSIIDPRSRKYKIRQLSGSNSG